MKETKDLANQLGELYVAKMIAQHQEDVQGETVLNEQLSRVLNEIDTIVNAVMLERKTQAQLEANAWREQLKNLPPIVIDPNYVPEYPWHREKPVDISPK